MEYVLDNLIAENENGTKCWCGHIADHKVFIKVALKEDGGAFYMLNHEMSTMIKIMNSECRNYFPKLLWHMADEEKIVIIYDFIEGQTLHDTLESKIKLTVDQILKISEVVFTTLYLLHKNDIVHHDLHCRNVMLNNMSGTEKILLIDPTGILEYEDLEDMKQSEIFNAILMICDLINSNYDRLGCYLCVAGRGGDETIPDELQYWFKLCDSVRSKETLDIIGKIPQLDEILAFIQNPHHSK